MLLRSGLFVPVRMKLNKVLYCYTFSSFCVSINIFCYEAPLCEVKVIYPASPGEIAKSFDEIEVPSGLGDLNVNSSGIYVSPSHITMKEIEPLLTIADLPPVFDFYLKLSTLSNLP